MTDLSAVAEELDALVPEGRRIRLGHRNFERPHADLDELVSRLAAAAHVVRVAAKTASTPVVTGRGYLLVSVARAVPGRHVELSPIPEARSDWHRPRLVSEPDDGS